MESAHLVHLGSTIGRTLFSTCLLHMHVCSVMNNVSPHPLRVLWKVLWRWQQPTSRAGTLPWF